MNDVQRSGRIDGEWFDLTRPRSVLVVGTGGPGMSAVSLVLAEMGHHVRGTDLRETPFLERLRAAGVDVRIGHRADHLEGIEAVCVSTAIGSNNLEVVEARRRSIPVLHRSAMLAAICARTSAIGVAGTHGKTTTTSMLALILRQAGLDPSFIVGGQLHDVGAGAAWTGAPVMVIEADESDGTFLELPLAGTILTNIDVDHLDHFGTVAELHRAFDRYLAAVSGPLVVCADDPVAARLASAHGAITYGTDPSADVRLGEPVATAGSQRFTVTARGNLLGEIELPVRGLHMARNATAAVAMALELGAGFDDARRALARYGGVARRFDLRGQAGDITFVDDYAHLPAEISSVLDAARNGGDGWQRVVAVFQPNRFSRMELMWADYADAFVNADVVVLADIYPSGERPRPGVTGKLVVNAVLDAHPAARVVYLPDRAGLAAALAPLLRPGDVCISMGCGDVASLPDELLQLVDPSAADGPGW